MALRNIYPFFAGLFIAFGTVSVQAQSDGCAAAVNLTVDAPCVSYSNSAATYEAPVSCFMNGDKTIWFKFTTSVAGFYSVVANTDGTSDPVLELYRGTCGALTSVQCVDAGVGGQSESITQNLTASTTYYVRVAEYAGGNGTFCMEVIYRPPIPNDCIANAIDVTDIINAVTGTGAGPFSCKAFQYANAGSKPTHDAVPGDNVAGGAYDCHQGALNGSDIYDIWFKFTVDASTPASVWLDAYPFEQSNTASYSAALYSGTPTGTCGGAISGLTYIDCSAGTFTNVVGGKLGGARDMAGCTLPRPRISVGGLAPGTYYYRVWEQLGDTPDGSVNICAESGTPIAPGEDKCPNTSPPNPPTFEFGCGTLPNWNVDETFTGLSNAGCFGNGNCVPPSTNEPQLAVSPAGQIIDGCTGTTWVNSVAYINNVINNTVIYSFEVNACASCMASVEIKLDNIDYGGVRDNVIQVQVMDAPCNGTGNAKMAYSTSSSCFRMRPTSPPGTTLPGFLPNGRYYIMVDGQDGQLIKYDLSIKINYSGGIGPSACTPSLRPTGKITADKTTVCPAENVTLNSTGTDVGMSGNTQALCGNVSYQWDIDGGVLVSGSLTGAGPIVVNWANTTSGNLTKKVKLVVTNNGCPSDVVEQEIIIKPTPNATFNVKSPVCKGVVIDDAVTYTGFARANATYTWNFGGGVATPGGTNQGPHDVSWATAGNKTITLSVTQDGCVSTVAVPKTIQVNDAPTSPFTVSKNPMCLGDNVVISYTGTGTSAGSYAWSFTSDPDVQIVANPDYKTYTVEWLSAGTKTITLTATDFGCTGGTTTKNDIVVNAAPVFTTTSTATGGCGASNGSAGVVSIQNQIAGTYTYSWNTTPTATLGNPLANVKAGNYTVTVTDPIGCFSSSVVTVVDGNAPVATLSNKVNVLCNGASTGSITISGTGGSGLYDISVYSSGNPTPVSSATGVASFTATNLAAGNYTFNLIDGACTTPGSFTITQAAKLIVSSGADKSICPAETATLSASVSGGTGPYQYSWDGGTTYAAVPTLDVSPATTTTYTVKVKDANSCEVSASSPATVTVKDVPNGSIAFDKTSLCDQEQATLTYTGNGTASDNYTWDFGGGNPAPPGTGIGPHVLNWTTTGTKTVSLTIDKNGCSRTLTAATIDVAPPPVADLTITPSTTICESETAVVEFIGTAPASATYTWNYDGGAVISTLVTDRKFVIKWPSAGAKTVTVKVQVGSSCVSNLASQTINVKPTPAAPADTLFRFCKNSGNKTIQLPNFPNANWYINLTDPALSGPPEISTATVRDFVFYASQTVNGCESSKAKIDVNVLDRQKATFSYTPAAVCQDYASPLLPDPSTYDKPGIFTANSTDLKFFNTSDGSVDIKSSVAKTYQVTYRTFGECPDTVTRTLTIRPVPSAGISYASKYCKNEPNPAVKLDPGATGQTFTATPAGLVFVPGTPRGTIDLANSAPGDYTITNSVTVNGCTAPGPNTAQVSIIAIPSSAFTLDSATCIKAPLVISTTAPEIPGASYTWDFGQGKTEQKSDEYGPSFEIYWNSYGKKAVSYSVNDRGCISVITRDSVEVINEPTAVISTSVNPAIVSLEENVAIGFNPGKTFDGPPEDAKMYEWSFGDGAATNDIKPYYTYSAANTYVVKLKVSNAANCYSEATTTVEVIDDYSVLVPTAFSPNGDDANERFYPSVVGASITSFDVYNRWGERVYAATDNKEGWNGLYKNENVPDGVYVYIIKARRNSDGSNVLRKGLVTVVR